MSKEKLYQRGMYLPYFPLEDYKHERTMLNLVLFSFCKNGISYERNRMV